MSAIKYIIVFVIGMMWSIFLDSILYFKHDLSNYNITYFQYFNSNDLLISAIKVGIIVVLMFFCFLKTWHTEHN